jgi:hypothetical protein
MCGLVKKGAKKAGRRLPEKVCVKNESGSTEDMLKLVSGEKTAVNLRIWLAPCRRLFYL